MKFDCPNKGVFVLSWCTTCTIKKKVNDGVAFVVMNNDCHLDFCFQANMKKRLHYAMPRVPLQKLRPDFDDARGVLDVVNQPKSHVGTIAKRIMDANRDRNQAESEDVEENVDLQLLRQETNEAYIRNDVKDKSAHRKCTGGGETIQKITEMAESIVDMNFNRNDRKQLRKIESRLRKVQQKYFTGILPGDESSGDNISMALSSDSSCLAEISEAMSDTPTEQENVRLWESSNEFLCADRFEVAADVHQTVDEMELGGEAIEEVELEGAVGDDADSANLEEDCIKEAEVVGDAVDQVNGHERSVIDHDPSDLASGSSDESGHQSPQFVKKLKGMKTRRPKEKKAKSKGTQGTKMDQTRVQWGQDESSESDGGWGF